MLLPGAILDPGAHWNYEAGVSSCQMEVWHYTVGRNSIALIRDRGLCAFLVRDEGIYEFAPSDAVCFTQCEFNRVATATEVESLDGSITPAQLEHLRYLTLWKLTTHGIPQTFYDGPRLPVGSPYRGVTNHRNLRHQACDMHSDGFDRWVWDYVTAPPPADRPGDTMASFLIHDDTGTGRVWAVDVDAQTKTWVRTLPALGAQIKAREIIRFTGGWADSEVHKVSEPDRPWAGLLADARDVDTFDDVGTGGGGGTGGASAGEVAAIVGQSESRVIDAVRSSEDRVRTDVNRPRTLT